MERDTTKLSMSVIEDLKGKGLSQSEIAEQFGVTRQAVSWHKKTYGGRLTPREEALEAWPWEVSADHTRATQYKRLRDHGEFMAVGPSGISEDKRKRLRAFYRKLREEGLVVEYDPAIPPDPGVSAKGGFAYRARKPEDGDLLIRVNEHTRLTEKGMDIWCFPPREP